MIERRKQDIQVGYERRRQQEKPDDNAGVDILSTIVTVEVLSGIFDSSPSPDTSSSGSDFGGFDGGNTGGGGAGGDF